jgi:transcriptional regulator with XRE-family HTH domain
VVNYFDTTKVGSKIKALRLERKLSMRELASKAGVAVSFISKIESGKTSPTIMTFQKIIEAIGISVVDFFTDDSNSPSNSIVFKQEDMKVLKDYDREWFFTFPSFPDIKVIMTYEEFQPKTQVREMEKHNEDLFGFIFEGELSLELPDRGFFKATKGDSFYIKSGTEHVAKNDTEDVLKMIVVMIK